MFAATMDGSKSVFQTMHSIMAIKTKELAKKRDNCKDLKAQLTLPLQDMEDASGRVKLLVRDAGRKMPPLRSGKLRYRDRQLAVSKKESSQHEEIFQLAGLSASNIQRLLDQSAKDPSISPVLFKDIEDKFISALCAKDIKYQYATLFSSLVSDALPERAALSTSDNNNDAVGAGSMDFEPVGRSAMQEQRETWESMVFSSLEINAEEVTGRLDRVFSTAEAKKSLYELRNSVDDMCRTLLRPGGVGVPIIKKCIHGLLAEDLLSQEQTSTLKDIVDNHSYLSEIADVLNLRLAEIETWSWGGVALPLEMRRQLNGKYRVFMQEEITQAIFIHYVGMKFATGIRALFHKFQSSRGWRKPKQLDKSDHATFDYFVGSRTENYPAINPTLMEDKFLQQYFMSVLPLDFQRGPGGYSAEDATNNAKPQTQQAVEAKMALVHILKTEGLLADREGQELCVIQTDFRWFGPNLSHSTIAAVLKYLGVTSIWLSFFDKFLKAPLCFVHDGPNAQIRVRQRGVPMSHALSGFLGESLLFCLDFAVNEATDGRPMFRLHDDIWIWGNSEQCACAWTALTDLTTTFGIELNEEKTASARLTSEATSTDDSPASLPKGPLKWGFLTIGDSGTVQIDATKIEEHIAEFHRQLKAQKSLMSWVKSYNAYCRFISFNLCRPANCLGRKHVDESMDVVQRIHRELFPSTGGSVTEYVRKMIRDKYDVDDVPDGFIYLPVTLGGLELFNPFIPLQNMRENVEEDPGVILEEAFEDDKAEYWRLKSLFDQSGAADIHALEDRPKAFFSYDEYAKFRRDRNQIFLNAWSGLMEPAEERLVEERTELKELVSGVEDNVLDDEQFTDWDPHSPYWRAVIDTYGLQMQKMFGSLQVVEKSLLPLGMVNLLKGKVRWES